MKEPDRFENIWEVLDDLIDRVAKLEDAQVQKKRASAERGELRRLFCSLWKERYGREYPAWGPKQQGLLKGWCTQVGSEAPSLIEAYLRWRDPFVTQRAHSFEILTMKTVELTAWMHDPRSQAQREASAALSKKSVTRESQELEEMRHHAERAKRQRSRPVLSGGAGSGGRISGQAANGVPGPSDGHASFARSEDLGSEDHSEEDGSGL